MWLSIVPHQKVPDFRGQVLAVEHVERLLRKVSNALDEAGVPYAIVGGNAVAAWVATVDAGAVRATKDVDLLLRKSDLATAADALDRVDLIQDEVLGITVFLDRRNPNPRTGVQIVFTGERIYEGDPVSVPDVGNAVRSAGGFLILDLVGLLTMKLTAFRDIDRVHVRDLISVGLVDDDLTRRLPEALRMRLEVILRTR